MKKVFFLIFLTVCIAALITPPVADAGTFFGTFCFQTMLGYTDIYVLNVEYTVGDGNFTSLTVSGKNMAVSAGEIRGMSGGGTLTGNTVKLFIGETAYNSPTYLGSLHSIVIDLNTWSGTDDIVLHKGDYTHALIKAEPIQLVACP